MKEYVCIWYDRDEEKCRDVVAASCEEEARMKAFTKYNGKPPAPMCSVVLKELPNDIC